MLCLWTNSFSTRLPRKHARGGSELQGLDERLANDGRDALADLRRELEDEAEARLEAERRRLKDEMSGKLTLDAGVTREKPSSFSLSSNS